jgi:hypothetical protein
MKKAWRHEDHNRQDKALRRDYRDDMLPAKRGTWSGASGSSTSTPPSWLSFTFSLDFSAVKPVVIEALQNSFPNIDLTKLVNAIRSELGGHKVHRQTSSVSRKPSVTERNKLLASVRSSASVACHFYVWHEDIDPHCAERLHIPEEFHKWLAKMVSK